MQLKIHLQRKKAELKALNSRMNNGERSSRRGTVVNESD